VPRNRVYSHYATRCGTERVVPLNPASFGKLVRVIFPGIQTRRLGVRGESKYHYVDLCLVDDASDAAVAGLHRSNSNSLHTDVSDMRRSASLNAHLEYTQTPRLPADAAAFPSHALDASNSSDGSAESQAAVLQVEPRGPPSTARLFAYPDTRGIVADNDCSIMYEQNLRFPAKDDAPFQENDTIVLPNILPFCPIKTDTDTAEALTALYRTHCTSLIDCIRFCKEKQFFRLFTSFHGTLTVPVQKLLAHANLAPWIQACDTLMYQKMVRFVSRLTLQAAPPVVINILNNISTNLHAHISKTFAAHPAHVLQAKLKPAATFASLLHRLIRVNAAAHAAANLLTVDQNREQMWREWVTMVNPKRVMEAELPACGYQEVYKIMTCDIRGLLEPLSSPPFPDNPLFAHDNQAYGYAQANLPTLQQPPPQTSDQSGQVSTENVLDRWSAFLSSLPSRFPEANTRLLLHCISAVGTAALRDITIMGGASYQTWWVMKIFVDEMALWLAAMGGFLEHNPVHATPAQASPPVKPVDFNTSIRSGSGSRLSSVDVEFKMQPQSRPASAQSKSIIFSISFPSFPRSSD
jgi:regulatory factor X